MLRRRHKCAWGEAPLAWVWGVRSWALSHARLPVLAACGRFPLPTGCGCGGCGRGDPSSTPQCALLRAGFARGGGGLRAPGGGGRLLPGCGASGVGRSPPPDRPLLGRAAGSRYPLAVGAGGVGVGTRHQPRSARSCELGLQAVGAALGRPGGGVSCMGVGSPGWGAHPGPSARPSGVRAVPATHSLWMRGLWALGPVTNPSARALASWLCALWGRHKGARGGGGAPLAWVWGVRGSVLSLARPPVLDACGRGLLPTGCGCGGRGHSRPSPSPQQALLGAGCAHCGGGTSAPGGYVSCLGVGRLVLGAHPRPTARPWGVRPGPATHWLLVRGVWAWGPVTDPGERALASWLCALWGRQGGARGGGASRLGAGRPVWGALARPTARPRGVPPGSATHWLSVRGVSARGPVTYPTARSC